MHEGVGPDGIAPAVRDLIVCLTQVRKNTLQSNINADKATRTMLSSCLPAFLIVRWRRMPKQELCDAKVCNPAHNLLASRCQRALTIC